MRKAHTIGLVAGAMAALATLALLISVNRAIDNLDWGSFADWPQ